MTYNGCRRWKCKKCGATKDLEAGINSFYCCAQEMVEVKRGEEREERGKMPKLDRILLVSNKIILILFICAVGFFILRPLMPIILNYWYGTGG